MKMIIPFAFLTVSLLLSSCGDSNAEKNEDTTTQRERAIPVAVVELKPQPFTETLHLSGSIKAMDDIMISPEEGGVVQQWHAVKGQYVQKGAVIVTLKDDVAKASYEAAEAQYASAQLTYEKQKSVFAEQAISEWQLKTAQFARDAAQAQAALMKARWERMHIKAPAAGILDDRYIDIGEMAPPGVPIARIVSINSVKVTVNIPERYAGSLRKGTALKLTVLAHPGEMFSGRITYVGSAISPDNRTFPTESIILNTGLKLKPEMIAKVQIEQSAVSAALLIDEAAIQQVDRNRMILYVANGRKAEEREVTLGGRKGNLVQLVSGAKAGEKVIIRGQKEIVDGQAIEVVAF